MPFAIGTPQIMTDFEGAWAQKWAQSFGVNPTVETSWLLALISFVDE